MIIVQVDGRQVGLIGDRVLDIVSVDASEIQKVPRTSGPDIGSFLAGIVTHDDVMIALIDLPNLLALDDAGSAATGSSQSFDASASILSTEQGA